ncbi:MAG: PKD domain-containing protein [Bacteroidota bacterium]
MSKTNYIVAIIFLSLIACEKNPWTEFERIDSNRPVANLRAQFNVNENGCLFPCDPKFENTSIDAISYAWYFGNGDSSFVENPQYVYEFPGDYKVMLIAQNFSLSDTTTRTVLIRDSELLVSANFEVNNNNCLAPCDPQLVNTSTNADSICWMLDNIKISTDDIPQYVFESPGTYEITLITFGVNSTDSIERTIEIREPITFEKTYSQPGLKAVGTDVVQADDNGYAIAAWLGSPLQNYFLKVDEIGTFQADKKYIEGQCYSISKATNGEYVFTGTTFDNNVSSIFPYVLKTNGLFDVLALHEFPGVRNFLPSVLTSESSDQIFSGGRLSKSDGQIYAATLRFDMNLSNKFDTLPYYSFASISNIIHTVDGELAFVGKDFNQNKHLVKTKNNMSEIDWNLSLPDIKYISFDRGSQHLDQSPNGDFIIVGYVEAGNAGSNDATLIKVSGNGHITWQKNYGGIDRDQGTSVKATKDGGYIFTGDTKSFSNGGLDLYLVKTNSNGEIEWERNYGGVVDDYGASVQETSDGGFIVVGGSKNGGIRDNIYLVKTASNGRVF